MPLCLPVSLSQTVSLSEAVSLSNSTFCYKINSVCFTLKCTREQAAWTERRLLIKSMRTQQKQMQIKDDKYKKYYKKKIKNPAYTPQKNITFTDMHCNYNDWWSVCVTTSESHIPTRFFPPSSDISCLLYKTLCNLFLQSAADFHLTCNHKLSLPQPPWFFKATYWT